MDGVLINNGTIVSVVYGTKGVDVPQGQTWVALSNVAGVHPGTVPPIVPATISGTIAMTALAAALINKGVLTGADVAAVTQGTVIA